MNRDDFSDPDSIPTASPEGAPGPGGRIGKYRILEKIGEGGMGEVWLAEQTDPVRRKVALKVIRRGMDSARVIARFEAERQALAMMDHPAIAAIHDAGTTPDGRPYFVMEYVRGIPINEYCDREALSTADRLRLFASVCDGVQHAHHKTIVHRDLKPSNVLVTHAEGKPYPKIIDFGVAKALSQPLTERTLHTEYGALVGTLEYMSPEQADLKNSEVDTRSDIYSLGVMLYELLVGALPFDRQEFVEAGFESMLRKIRQEDPPRPSVRLRTMDGAKSEESARKRGVPTTALLRELSGDLDWIAMKALAKSPSRRYTSAAELAADLQAYLESRPVAARPPSVAYRLRKFAGRHRAAVSALIVVGVAALALGALMAWQAARLEVERERVRREAEYAVDAMFELNPDRARGGEIRFTFDLDRLAPLGDGPDNAAFWFADFVRSGGARYEEWQRAIARGSSQSGGRQSVLLPNDPLLVEAERWVDQATLRFYPDVWPPVDGFRTQLPNLLMMMQLAHSWIQRGDAQASDRDALEDYRRVIRLGRLLRQENAWLITDSVGMRLIRMGLEAMERRLRDAGDAQRADTVALALYDLKVQQVRSAMLFRSIRVAGYEDISWFGTRLDVPDWKLSHIATVATSHPERRFRVEAAMSLCLTRWRGKRRQRRKAREYLETVSRTDDPLLAGVARCAEEP